MKSTGTVLTLVVLATAAAAPAGITGFAGGHLAAHLLELGDIEVHGAALDQGYGLDFLPRPVAVTVANLQNAETIRVVTPKGSKPVTELKAGDEVVVHLAARGGRHFGISVPDETVIEK